METQQQTLVVNWKLSYVQISRLEKFVFIFDVLLFNADILVVWCRSGEIILAFFGIFCLYHLSEIENSHIFIYTTAELPFPLAFSF